jgi:hypothetical protein
MSTSNLHDRQQKDKHNTSIIVTGSRISLQSVLGDFGYKLLRWRHYLTFVLIWLRVIVIVLFTSFKVSLIRAIPDSRGWQVTVSYKSGYVLITLYMAIVASTLAIIIRLWDVSTGLKWDPSSYAAQLSLLQKSNVSAVLRALDLNASASNLDLSRKLRHYHRL